MWKEKIGQEGLVLGVYNNFFEKVGKHKSRSWNFT